MVGGSSPSGRATGIVVDRYMVSDDTPVSFSCKRCINVGWVWTRCATWRRLRCSPSAQPLRASAFEDAKGARPGS